MDRRTAGALSAAVLTAMGALGGACSDDSSAEGDFVTTTTATSGGGAFGDGSTGPGASATSVGAGGGAGAPLAPPAPIPPPPEDDEPSCEELDQSESLVLYLSADDSNSMASPAFARERLRIGMAPAPIRTYEFLNYYRVDYPAPAAGQLGIFPQLEPGEKAGTYDFQIGVRAFDPPSRRPVTITFVLDTSGSMGGTSIARERAVVLAVAERLVAGDIVNMVTWNTANNVVLDGHTVAGPNDATLLAAADAITASGGTDLNAGLQAGYALATEHYGAGRLNRLVLISDGGANAGVTDKNLIAEHSEDADQEGIYLVGVGTGPASGYNDTLMDVVTDAGRGAYVYIDGEDEARHVFVDRFDEVMEVAARGVQVEVSLPWYFRMHRFYGEEYSDNPDEVEPQHLAPGDAMVFSQVLRACDPEVVVDSDAVVVTARWETPLTYTAREVSVSLTLGEMLAADKAQLHKGKAIVAFAEALKAPSVEAFGAAMSLIQAADPEGEDDELTEIAGLIQMHPSYQP